MATNYNIESFFRATIQDIILDTETVPLTKKVSKLPYLTSWLLTISPNSTSEEIVEYSHSWTPWTTWTITITKRAINPHTVVTPWSWVDWVDYNVTWYFFSHKLNDSIRGDITHIHINQAVWEWESVTQNWDNTFLWNNTFNWKVITTKEFKLPTYASTWARDIAITSPSNWDICDVGWTIYKYNEGTAQWETLDVWTPTPLASTTVGWIVEISTDTQITSWTETWETWAILVPTPAQIKKSISLKNSASTIADANEFWINVSGEDQRLSYSNFKTKLSTDYAPSDTSPSFAERATDAEALAGTDTTRYVTPAQASNKYANTFTTTTFSWTTTDATTSYWNAITSTKWMIVSLRINWGYPTQSDSFNLWFQYSTDWVTYNTLYSTNLSASQSTDEYYTYMASPWIYVRAFYSSWTHWWWGNYNLVMKSQARQ